jgi:glucose-1-phosphate thymidylyltransferase
MVAHVIDALQGAGVDHITLIVGYLGDALVSWAKTAYPSMRIDFAVQEKPDGLASAVLLAEKYATSGPTMVVLGDTLFAADLTVLKGEKRNLIVTSPVEDPSRFGVVVMEKNRVVRLVEKPSEPVSNLAIVGVYYFADGEKLMHSCRELREKSIRTRGEYQLTDAMQLMLQNGEPFGILDIDGWFDCGKPESLIQSNRELLARNGSSGNPVLENSRVISPCFFGEGSKIVDSVVGPYFSCGCNVLVSNSRISDSIAGDSSVFSGTVLSCSVTGERVAVSGISGKVFLGDDSVAKN